MEKGPAQPQRSVPRGTSSGSSGRYAFEGTANLGARSAVATRSGPIGVIVVNYGSHALIRANLAGLSAHADSVVVVVDNFSTAEEQHAMSLVASARGWEFLALPDNLGFGHAVNAGVGRALERGCVSLLLLNPDAVVLPEVIAELHSQSLREPDTLISPVIVDSSGAVVFRGAELELGSGQLRSLGLTPRGRRARPWMTAACLVVHADMFERIGGFDESYFLYWEDVDLSCRAAQAGASLTVRHDLRALHDEGMTQPGGGGRAKSDIYYYYNCRNRLLFGSQHLSTPDLVRWILRTPSASWAILMRGGRRQLLHSTSPLRAVVRGSLAGLVIAGRALLTRRSAVPRHGHLVGVGSRG